MKIKKKYLGYDYISIGILLFLISLKLIFSYLLVEPGYWLRHLPTNYEKFNFLNLPQNFSSHLEYLILPLMVSFLLVNYKYLGKLKVSFVFTFVLIAVNFLTAFLNDKSIFDSINLTLKLISPIYLFIALIVFSKKHHRDLKKPVFRIINLCLILAIIALMVFDISVNRMVEQWPIYFANIHTHSYIMVCVCIAYSLGMYKKGQRTRHILFLILSFLLLYFGYNVRTTLVMYLLYIFIILFLLSDVLKFLWVQLLILLPFVALIIFFTIQSFDVNQYSSGRLDMYKEKLEILEHYSFPELLLGRGYGADFIKTETWWWEEKGSHNDYITFITENGALYLIVFVFLILSLFTSYRKINLIFLFLILGYLTSSAISNGIAARPLAGYVFFLVLSLVYTELVLSKQKEPLILKNDI